MGNMIHQLQYSGLLHSGGGRSGGHAGSSACVGDSLSHSDRASNSQEHATQSQKALSLSKAQRAYRQRKKEKEKTKCVSMSCTSFATFMSPLGNYTSAALYGACSFSAKAPALYAHLSGHLVHGGTCRFQEGLLLPSNAWQKQAFWLGIGPWAA